MRDSLLLKARGLGVNEILMGFSMVAITLAFAVKLPSIATALPPMLINDVRHFVLVSSQ
jgi:hypothetical protein